MCNHLQHIISYLPIAAQLHWCGNVWWKRNSRLLSFCFVENYLYFYKAFMKLFAVHLRKLAELSIDKSGLFSSEVSLTVKSALGWTFYLNLTAAVVPEWALKKKVVYFSLDLLCWNVNESCWRHLFLIIYDDILIILVLGTDF